MSRQLPWILAPSQEETYAVSISCWAVASARDSCGDAAHRLHVFAGTRDAAYRLCVTDIYPAARRREVFLLHDQSARGWRYRHHEDHAYLRGEAPLQLDFAGRSASARVLRVPRAQQASRGPGL